MDTTDNQNLIIPAARVPVAAYQAIYHKLTGKVESTTKPFFGAYEVTFADISSLHHKLDQAISQYQVQSRNCEYTFSTRKGENFRFTSFDRLEFANLQAYNKPVAAFGLELDFLVVLPSEVEQGDNIAQRYRVLVTIEDDEWARRRRSARTLFSIELQEPKIPTGQATVHYSDFSVSRTLLSIIDEWFEEVDRRDPEGITEKSETQIDNVAGWLVGILPISIISAGILFEPQKYGSDISPIRYLLLIILLCIVALIIAGWADSKVNRLTGLLRSRTRFSLTSGDDKARSELIQKRKRSRAILVVIFGSVLLALGVGVCSNYVAAKLIGVTVPVY